MKEIFRLAHYAILLLFVLTGNTIYDYVLNGIIAVIAYMYAFNIVGGISGELGYNSILMSFTHWTIRTLVSIVMITLVKILYFGVIAIVSIFFKENAEIVSISTCVVLTVSFAEFLKSKTGLHKNYF